MMFLTFQKLCFMTVKIFKIFGMDRYLIHLVKFGWFLMLKILNFV